MYLLVDEKGRKYMVKGTADVHTNYGVIKADELSRKKFGDTIETQMGRKFFIIKPGIPDFMEKARRGPQAISLKDCAMIAGWTGIHSNSRVLEAGVGSGILSMFLANIIAPERLISYEIREDFAKIAKENFERYGINNIEIKMKNIYEGIDEKELDLIVLDLPEPWKVAGHAKKSLSVDGFLVSYSPSIEQSKKFCDELNGFMHETIECLVRNWDMKVVRPYSRMLAHTGFITFARWIGEGL